MAAMIKIRNWDKWQSYRKDRGQPPWIKVHRSLMRDVSWVSLTDAQRGQLVAMWMLAADHDGSIPADHTIIRKLCFMESAPDLKAFIDVGFIEGRRRPDAAVTPDRRPSDQPETEKSRDRVETEVAPSSGAALTSSESNPLTPLQLIVRAWKIQTGVEADDEAWDKAHFKRHCRPAQSLLNLFGGDVDSAVDCIEDVYQRLVTDKNLDLSLQGVVNNSGRFRQEWSEQKEKRRSA